MGDTYLDNIVKELCEKDSVGRILILGNGFDLHLNLKSSFADFFSAKILDKGFLKTDNNNLLYLLLYLRFYSKRTGCFFRSVDNKNPNWMDVERFIKKIATEFEFLKSIYESDLRCNKSFQRDYFQAQICRIIQKRVDDSTIYDFSTIKKILLEDLIEFEKDFASYIAEEVSKKDKYSEQQSKFVDEILSKVGRKPNEGLATQIINFNYTRINSILFAEANVHGVLDSNIIIGYDSTEKTIVDKDIFELSKEWQKMDVDFSYEFEHEDIKTIIIYGHSLGSQDYPYFFDLFDKYNLFSGDSKDVSLCFCYSKFGTAEKQRDELMKYKMNAAKLLNAYERYRSPNITRTTIVTRLKTQKRIFFVEV